MTTTGWLLLFICLALGLIVGNLLLIRRSKRFDYDPKKLNPKAFDDDE